MILPHATFRKKFKKMKFLFYFLFIPFISFSQVNYKVQYDVQLNSFQRKGFLIFNKNNVHYYEITPHNSNNSSMSEKDGNKEFRLIIENKMEQTRRQLYTFEKDTVINIDYLEDEIVTYFEIPEKMNWEITNDTKKISGYNCNKATTKFRGRYYTAWINTEIPIKFGPWKFTNTPGLIMEIVDDSGKFSWFATKIETTDEPIEYPLDEKIKIITLKDFVAKQDKINEERATLMQLKFATRETKVKKVTIARGREKTFEWEE